MIGDETLCATLPVGGSSSLSSSTLSILEKSKRFISKSFQSFLLDDDNCWGGRFKSLLPADEPLLLLLWRQSNVS